MREPLDTGLERELQSEIESKIRDVGQLIHDEAAASGTSLYDPVVFEADADSTPRNEDVFASCVDRRTFMRGGAATVGAVAVASTLQMFAARSAEAQSFGKAPRAKRCPYGDPVPTLDEVTGLPLIGLPPGFRYWSYGWTGDPIFPGVPNLPTPALHDGMGVLRQVGGLAILCRNHEVANAAAYIDGRLQYSGAAGGGTTNVIFDTRKKRWIAGWPTLSGTIRNCSGGVTPHATWLTCEETTIDTTFNGKTFSHGWVFEVPAIGTSDAKPIKAMGRRSHEAAAVDPRTGIVYLTEDTTPGGVYRFTPKKKKDYLRDGQLEVLKIKGRPNANLYGLNPIGGGGAPYPAPVGNALDIEWVPVDDPENLSHPSNFAQGETQGAARFRRPEGTSYGDGNIYFVCTDGGVSGNGQIFAINLRKQQLTLIYDSPTANELDNPDNAVVTPRGGLLFCEDNSGLPEHVQDGFSTERLVGLSKSGEIFTFATNLMNFSPTGLNQYTRPNNAEVFNQNYRGNEWAGAAFDASGKWLFANVQTPGVTFAITGPWEHGPL